MDKHFSLATVHGYVRPVMSLLLLATCAAAAPGCATAGEPNQPANSNPGFNVGSDVDTATTPDAVAAAGSDAGSAPSSDAGTAPANDASPGQAGGFELARMALSGSRLKVKVHKSADGAMVPMLGFYDSKFAEKCAAQLAADGKVRCLPTAFGTGGLFADAACKVPAVVLVSPDAKHITLQKQNAPGTCSATGASVQIFNSGPVLEAAAAFKKLGDQCVPLDDATAKAYACYQIRAVGAEVSPSEFAELEEVTLN